MCWNIWQGDDDWIIQAFAPGLDRDHLNVSLENNELTITGQFKHFDNEAYQSVTHEFSDSDFTKTYRLPSDADTDTIEASYNDGVIHLRIPKKNQAIKPLFRSTNVWSGFF